MNRILLLTCALGLFGVASGSAQGQAPINDPARTKDCARTMTFDMRNCNGQAPDAKEKAPKSGESAQGDQGYQLACNNMAYMAYLQCVNGGGYGVAKKPVPSSTPVAKTTSKNVAPAPKSVK